MSEDLRKLYKLMLCHDVDCEKYNDKVYFITEYGKFCDLEYTMNVSRNSLKITCELML